MATPKAPKSPINPAFIKVVLSVCIGTQISHTEHLFETMSKTHDLLSIVTSYAFAFGLESSVYVFTVFGKSFEAKCFAAISFVINMLYYNQTPDLSTAFISQCVLSIIVPVIVWRYSELAFEYGIFKPQNTRLKAVSNQPINRVLRVFGLQLAA